MKQLAEKYVVVTDVGTEANKAAIVDFDGRDLASTTEEYDVCRPKPGWAEQDPEVWWNAIVKTTRKVIKKANVNPKNIVGMSFDCMMTDVIPVDSRGRALRPALLWLDTRSQKQYEKYVRECFDETLEELVQKGVYPPTSPKDVIPKILWIKENEPEIFESARKFVDVKDYMINKCVGDFYTDKSTALAFNLFNFRKMQWNEELVASVGLSLDHLSHVVDTTDVVGNLTEDAASSLGLPTDTQVICGTGDVPAVGIGSGAIRKGKKHLYLGTSSWIGLHTDEILVDPKAAGGTLFSGDPTKLIFCEEMESAGACMKWFRDVLGEEEKEIERSTGKSAYGLLDELAEKAEPGSRRLIFTPWMAGERCPFTDPNVRGGFINLSLRHEKKHLVRAVMEGVAYNARWVQENVERLGLKDQSLRACGGGAKSDIWLQIFADVMNKKIERIPSPQDVGCMGAAYVALVGLSVFKNFDSIEDAITIEKEFYPNDENRKVYNGIYDIFKTVPERLADVHSLNEVVR